MANPWFRMYAEFATDAKVQSMSEAMQRRLMMLFCLRCSDVLATLQEDELAFAMRLNSDELAETKALFVRKGFTDSEWNLLNWDKRQFNSDSSTERSRKHRNAKKESTEIIETLRNVAATPPDTDTDTDKEANASVGSADKSPRCDTNSVVSLYHEILPELPAVRLMNDNRRKAVSAFWRFVLTSKKSDGTPRATDAVQAMEWIRGYFTRARDNDFLMGRGNKAQGHEGWQCDFDFLLTEKGKKHVIEKTREAA
jgi:uncharacterized protein YgfB (UPF0149 family)